jgi:hypothetical protein
VAASRRCSGFVVGKAGPPHCCLNHYGPAGSGVATVFTDCVAIAEVGGCRAAVCGIGCCRRLRRPELAPLAAAFTGYPASFSEDAGWRAENKNRRCCPDGERAGCGIADD